MTLHETFLLLLRSTLWGEKICFEGRKMAQAQYQSLIGLAHEQAVAGLIGQSLIDSGLKLPKQAAMEVYALTETIRQRNEQMDMAVADLSCKMENQGIRIIVFKGQTLAKLYPDAGLRQSGDIDFICHPDDWSRAMAYFQHTLGVKVKNTNSNKHVEFELNDIQYEMHSMLTSFAYPPHQRYWENVVMKQVWNTPCTIDICGQAVPILAPTYNALYVFIHIFYHLIIEGIGLRQFCDWAKAQDKLKINNEELKMHLEGIGLYKAYTGLGAILTDHLGLPMQAFPFPITNDDHKSVPVLMENIWKMGNFGHNVQYIQKRGVVHGLQRLGRTAGQAKLFYHYAPAEAWWRIPQTFKWWGVKIHRFFQR
ncbi:MAG: nucleotidyltransferase family protein [Bacteroidaceae bacterium]|nr:nucleotidyltransferase family protein [Bacteroidaceae bacterium]